MSKRWGLRSERDNTSIEVRSSGVGKPYWAGPSTSQWFGNPWFGHLSRLFKRGFILFHADVVLVVSEVHISRRPLTSHSDGERPKSLCQVRHGHSISQRGTTNGGGPVNVALVIHSFIYSFSLDGYSECFSFNYSPKKNTFDRLVVFLTFEEHNAC